MDRTTYCIKTILDLEGGYVWDPRDPGGETKYGISKRSYPNVDIKNLTETGAENIYLRDYWKKVSANSLLPPLDLYVFDAAVNQGVKTAIHLLQSVCGVPITGVMDSQTLAASRTILPNRYLQERAVLYSRNSNWTTYGTGWLNRLLIICRVG